MKRRIAVLLTIALLLSLSACGDDPGVGDPPLLFTKPTAEEDPTEPTVTPTTAPTQAPTAEPTQEPTAAPTEEPTFPPVTADNLSNVAVIKHTDYWFIQRNLKLPEGMYVAYWFGVHTGKYQQILDVPVYQIYKASTCIYYTLEENATQLMRCDYDGKNQQLAYTATVGTITKVSSCDAEDLQQLYVLENSTHVFKVDLNTGEKTPVVTHDQACQILTQQFGIQEDWATHGKGCIAYISAETYGVKENWNFSIGIGDYILFFDLRTGEFLRYTIAN